MNKKIKDTVTIVGGCLIAPLILFAVLAVWTLLIEYVLFPIAFILSQLMYIAISILIPIGIPIYIGIAFFSTVFYRWEKNQSISSYLLDRLNGLLIALICFGASIGAFYFIDWAWGYSNLFPWWPFE